MRKAVVEIRPTRQVVKIKREYFHNVEGGGGYLLLPGIQLKLLKYHKASNMPPIPKGAIATIHLFVDNGYKIVFLIGRVSYYPARKSLQDAEFEIL